MDPAAAAPAAAAAEAAPAEGAFPSQYDESGVSSFDRVEMDLRGASLTIICAMPDGQEITVKCNMGHDVAYAKGQLARATDIPYQNLQLFLDEKLMFDPLSFNDFPAVLAAPDQRIRVRVEVAA
uniref:Ubiquitin-like domain-containing protein n=1 Tax=Alexandrium catenella TaxID=2925 RepID=A0A7S1RIR3_ALECA|mmetsp:Transcript_59391/g.159026  ORF Transcript_59391/g.159026 Transcript_59391/m.159026 type:complete len:124 (+) Transcript_59391:74-445(+)